MIGMGVLVDLVMVVVSVGMLGRRVVSICFSVKGAVGVDDLVVVMVSVGRLGGGLLSDFFSVTGAVWVVK